VRVRLDANGSPKEVEGGKKKSLVANYETSKKMPPKNISTFPNLTLSKVVTTYKTKNSNLSFW
jgi:hypothetical protein